MKQLFVLCSVLCCISCGENKALKENFNASSLDHLKAGSYNHGVLNNFTDIHLSHEEKKAVLRWIESSRHLNRMDHVSYSPGFIVDCDGVQINFLGNWTILNYKSPQNSKAGWKQYSRKQTEEDKKILDLLKMKSHS